MRGGYPLALPLLTNLAHGLAEVGIPEKLHQHIGVQAHIALFRLGKRHRANERRVPVRLGCIFLVEHFYLTTLHHEIRAQNSVTGIFANPG